MLGDDERREEERKDEEVDLDDKDLVVLLLGGRQEKTFVLPGPGGEPSDFFVRLRMWTGVDRDEWYALGLQQFEVPLRKGGQATGMRFEGVSPGRRFRALLEAVVVDYKLATEEGEPASIRRPGDFGAPDWAVFRSLHPRIKEDWLVPAISGFLGIETPDFTGERQSDKEEEPGED